MQTHLLLSVIVALIMLSDAYLRYLAFKDSMTREEKRTLWRRLLLPLIALFGPLFLMADGELIHTHEERISRIFLPLLFLFFYYIVASIADHTYKRLSLEQESNLLKAQLACLAERQKLTEENQKSIAVLRHDMKHDYRMIHSMLLSNNIQEAAEYIKTREEQIENATVISYSTSPLVNAALTIYFSRAENLGVKLSHKINLPQDLKTSEEDLAILLSNLLENAVNASSKQPENKREISLLINRKNRKIVIELTNRCDAPVAFDKNGLPLPSKTDSETHGIGMLSVQSFVRKYNAYADFSQQNGVVKAYVYWEE